MLGLKQSPKPLIELVGGKKSIQKQMRQSNLFTESQITVEKIPSEYVKTQNGISFVSIGKILQLLEGCACPMGVLSREFLGKLRLDKSELAIVDMEAENDGYTLIDLFGTREFVRGQIKKVDFVKEHFVLIGPE